MDRESQNKVLDAGFTIIRKDDYPLPRIKARIDRSKDWKTLNKYTTKAERDRVFKGLLEDKKTISD